MPHFTKRIETDNGTLNFYFNRIFTAGGTHYHVSAIGRDRKAVMFNVEERHGKWVLVNKDNCPKWLVNAENKISDAIIEYKLTS